ncbi:HEPN domain-containing protein [Bacillus wiedmannii]|uniref:HEPN domain-containing protein n=1 Tax=Bacillus wiedmannii TaxID=1890302 RepID=UPI000BF76DE9|nr:HEPN domain-containing protein [Bacillus wiedmannii]MDM5264835.1 HEPN domain-containing protein [Bacillus wiedmannii]PFZ98849.1 hypothetical protein COL83_04485 [Bacillus wiedmannii]
MTEVKMNTTISQEKFSKVHGFFNIAYQDYLAARTLFNQDQLYRAIILANTAIEKYFKVFLAMQGRSLRTHNVSKLFKAVKEFDSRLKNIINNEFIELISLAYHMRYFDDSLFTNQNQEFHLHVCKNKSLAELDEIVYHIENSWTFRSDNKVLKRKFQIDIENQEKLLFENNFKLNRIDKTKFIEQEESVYQIQNTRTHGVIEAYYKTSQSKNDGKFI